MEKYNLSVENRVLGILAGNDTPESMLKFWAQRATLLIAADKGADHLVAAGFFPHVVLGDLDSITLDREAHSFDVHKFDDQDYSDCDKLLEFIENQGHQNATIIGFEGDRIDHMLAGIGSFLRSPLKIRVAMRHGLAHVQKSGRAEYTGFSGQIVSLLPILPCHSVTTHGLEWELKDAELRFGSRVSLSNLSASDRFSVEVDEGALLVVQEFDEARLPEW